jgi:adenosylcobyric acid synthase
MSVAPMARRWHGRCSTSADGRIAGCYVHGLFAADGFRAAFLAAIRPRAGAGIAYDATVDATLDGLADHLERHLDVAALAAIAGLPG